MSKLWRKRGDDSSLSKSQIPFLEWAYDKDLFSTAKDPWKRTLNLLTEIQKRTLAEQVLLITFHTENKQSKVIGISPHNDPLFINEELLQQIFENCIQVQQYLTIDDIGKDPLLLQQLENENCNSLLVYPLETYLDKADFLMIFNYLGIHDADKIMEFMTFVSSVLIFSLQNSRLYSELRNKEAQLKEWTNHVEERIEEGTKKLIEKEFQYHALFEGANDSIIVQTPAGKILEANHIACDLLGYTKKEIINLQWKDLSVREVLGEQEAFFAKILKREKLNPMETKLKKKNGESFYADLSSRRVWVRGDHVIQTFIRDISLRKRLEQSVREAKEKYRILVESSLMGVFIIRDGIIHFVNETFRKMTGYSNEELFEKNFYDLMAPEDRSKVISHETRIEDQQDVPTTYEVRYLNKTGKKRWGEIRSCRVILDGKSAVLGNFIDISHRKELELHFLENQKMESIGTLAGGIAHDFNNLLGGILGYASLLLSDMTPDHPFYNDIYAIAETSKRGADLTNRLLAFARGGKYQVIPLNLNQIVKDVVAILSRTMDKSVIIETHLEEDLWKFRGDGSQIHQAIHNICLNARDVMPEGGKMVLHTSNEYVEKTPYYEKYNMHPGNYICVRIMDTGIGMDEKTKSRIFEPFYTTKPPGEGTGLGLAMVYGVVKNHEGFIFVDSEIGKGTTITLFFPRFQRDDYDNLTPDVTVITEKVISVLLVDDEDIIRKVGKRMLEKAGFEVRTASNGKDALEIYKKQKDSISIVIMDLIMPEMGGKETYHKLQEINPEIKVIFTSGYGLTDRPDFQVIGHENFIQKPFQSQVLIDAIKKILNRQNEN